MAVTYENPPKSESTKSLKVDENDYCLVQVTQNDINAGENKVNHMQRDGWVLAPEKDTNVDGYFYMKKLKVERIALEKKRHEQYMAWQDKKVSADTMGDRVEETVELEEASIVTNAITKAAIQANQ